MNKPKHPNLRRHSQWLATALFATTALASTSLLAGTVWLDDLDLTAAAQGWGEPHKNQSIDSHPITIGGKTFDHGFGTHAESTLRIKLNNGAQKFSASVGVDDEVSVDGLG